MQQDLLEYSLSFKIITIIFLLFCVLIGRKQGGVRMVFLAGFSSDAKESDVTIMNFPNVCVLFLSSYTFALFMNLLGFSFFEDTSAYGVVLDSLVLLVLIVIKIVVVYFSSIVLDEGNLFKAVDKESLSYLSWMTLICLALSFVVLNYNLKSHEWCIILVVLIEVLWYFRLSIVLLQSTKFNSLYFFSYLCSLEIMPTLALATYVGVI